MRSRIRRGAGLLRAAVVMLAVALVTLTSVGAVPPPAAAAPDDGGLRVEIIGLSPAAPGPGQDLTVTGTVYNGADAEVRDVYVNLRLQRNAPTSRRLLDLWLDTSVAFATRSLAEDFLDGPLAVGATEPFSFTLPAERLELPETTAAWGPRGISVNVSGTAVAGQSPGAWLTDSTRSLIVWAPGSAPVTTTVSVVIPLIPTATELATAQRTGATVAEASADRVDRIAAATSGLPEVAWALDATLLLAPAPQDDGAPDAPPGLTAAAAMRETLLVPFADADVAALAAQGATGLVDDAFAAGADVFVASGVTPLPVAWPAEAPDPETLEAYAAQGARAVALPSDRMPTVGVGYTATGRASLEVDGASVDALLWDEELSAALSGSAPAVEPEDLGDAATAVAARQYLLAVTALVGLERPAYSRHLLLTVERTGEVEPMGLKERLDAIDQAPWVSVAPISDLLAEADPDVERGPLTTAVPPEGLVSGAQVAAVTRAREEVRLLGEVLSEPALVVDPLDRMLLEVVSAAWRPTPGARTAFLAQAEAAIRSVDASMGVEAGGTVNLISASGELPVTVRNDLDQAVTVLLRLTPRDPSLQVKDLVEVEAPARSAQPVTVPVTAIGSADVEILGQLLTPSGQPVGTATTWTVRVRAGWEGLGTAVVAGAVGILFVVGMVRTIRRGRRGPDGEPTPAEPPATSTDGASL